MDNALILIAEDDPEIAQILRAYLERDQFRTVCAEDGEIALVHHQMMRPDLVLLDVNMPKRDGFEVLAEVRRRGATPVIMITARAEDLDKLFALRVGADDYVVKPFNPLEVVARTKAVLRRAHGVGGDVARLRSGPLELDSESYTVWADGGERPIQLDLTLTEYRLVAHLMRQPSRVYSRSELVDACLPDGDALDRTVDSHISKIRRKLESAGVEGYCVGVRGVGYRLAPQ